MDILDKRAGKIINKLTDIIAQTEELKLDNGTTPRAVRQWKKDVRTKYLSLVEDKEKLTREVKRRQDDLERESEQRQTELEEKRQQLHERRMAELRERQEEHERVEDRGENDQLDVHREFKENIVHDINGRYEVKVPWIPGTQLSETNETQSRLRLKRVEKKLEQDECLRKDYEKIIIDQVAAGIIEKAPDTPTGERVFYMPHKPVIKQDAITTKTRMVFDASAKPQPISSSVNEC
ncbi:Hypothetical predicted protein, partial [Paramuricea clavata]